MTLATVSALLSQLSPFITIAAGWLGAKLHTVLSVKKADANHQAISNVISTAIAAAMAGAAGTPNGANGDK